MGEPGLGLSQSARRAAPARLPRQRGDGTADPARPAGYADFEAQNLRWHGQQVWAVHDWDSLAWQPEAALAGAASGAFASAGRPTLAPIESSEAFLVAYQDIRGRLFTGVEQEIAWAASLWMAAYNVWEALHGDTPLSGDTVTDAKGGRSSFRSRYASDVRDRLFL